VSPGPSSRAVWGVGLRQPACWHRGFESVVECCVLSGRGLCDELITRLEESYRLWCVIVCDLETSRIRRSWPALGCSATKKGGWGGVWGMSSGLTSEILDFHIGISVTNLWVVESLKDLGEFISFVMQGQFFSSCANLNPLKPNDHYSGRTAPLTSERWILYIYSTNMGTEYFKHGIYSPSFSLQNAVCFIILTYFFSVLLTFYIQGVLKLKKLIPTPNG